MSDKEIESVADPYGWIKLSRKIRQSPIWSAKSPYDERSAWIELLLSATYDKSEIYDHASKSVIKLEPGQMLTSIKGLSETWQWSTSKVSRYLNNLQEMGMIAQNRTTKYTVITICNWAKYQGQADKVKKGGNAPAPAQEPVPQPEPAPATPAVPAEDKPWEEMTPAEQAAYLRK